ncbi:hypothetical protein U1Q18_021776, partial [Sarracenia purpurea var. burkii]
CWPCLALTDWSAWLVDCLALGIRLWISIGMCLGLWFGIGTIALGCGLALSCLGYTGTCVVSAGACALRGELLVVVVLSFTIALGLGWSGVAGWLGLVCYVDAGSMMVW